jgi:hypothetical protein
MSHAHHSRRITQRKACNWTAGFTVRITGYPSSAAACRDGIVLDKTDP